MASSIEQGTEKKNTENDVEAGGTISKKSLQDPQVLEEWTRQQFELKEKLITEDEVDWFQPLAENPFCELNYVGGVDISFQKDDVNHACASLVVLSFPDLEVIYKDLKFVHLSQPYIPEFLAFREVPFLIDCITTLRQENPDSAPQVVFVDGNGILHPRGFGIACHLGVAADIPTIGIAKKLFHVDGLQKDSDHLKRINESLQDSGDTFYLTGDSGRILGLALRSSKSSSNPVYVSIGHKLCLESAAKLVKLCCKHRVPEPIRQADICSRKYLRDHYNEAVKDCWCKNQDEEQGSACITQTAQLNTSLHNLHISGDDTSLKSVS